jgi:hypothetical protein
MEKLSIRRTFTLKSEELPELNLSSSDYGLETVLNKDSYYSRLRLVKPKRSSSVLGLAS